MRITIIAILSLFVIGCCQRDQRRTAFAAGCAAKGGEVYKQDGTSVESCLVSRGNVLGITNAAGTVWY